MKLKAQAYLKLAAEDWKKKYDQVGNFYGGFAQVRLGGKWGFVDVKGKVVIPLEYDQVGNFSKGLAGVKLNDKWGFVDATGKEVVPPKYDSVGYFSEGLAKVRLDDLWGFVDTTGKEVVPVRYTDEELPPFSSLIRLGGDSNVILEQISS